MSRPCRALDLALQGARAADVPSSLALWAIADKLLPFAVVSRPVRAVGEGVIEEVGVIEVGDVVVFWRDPGRAKVLDVRARVWRESMWVGVKGSLVKVQSRGQT